MYVDPGGLFMYIDPGNSTGTVNDLVDQIRSQESSYCLSYVRVYEYVLYYVFSSTSLLSKPRGQFIKCKS
jgi:hypothetical protein